MRLEEKDKRIEEEEEKWFLGAEAFFLPSINHVMRE